jgi:hypothetical protein
MATFSPCSVCPCPLFGSELLDIGLLDVVARACDGTVASGFTGRTASSELIPFTLSGTLQQFKKEKKPRDFFGFCIGADCDVVALTSPAFLPATAGDMADVLLLVRLSLRFLSMMLEFDSFDCPPMLSVGSLAVAPLSAVDVGEGCILCDDDRDGTWRRAWFFFGVSIAVADDWSSNEGTEMSRSAGF